MKSNMWIGHDDINSSISIFLTFKPFLRCFSSNYIIREHGGLVVILQIKSWIGTPLSGIFLEQEAFTHHSTG